MDTGMLLQWHYMIFLVPFAISALLFVLTTLRVGGRHGVRGHGPHAAHAPTHAAHTPAAPTVHAPHAAPAAPATHSAPASRGGHSPRTGHHGRSGRAAKGGETSVLLSLMGAGKAPLPLLLQSFCLNWGFWGFWTNRLLLADRVPSLPLLFPSLAVALVGGALGARLSAEVFAWFLPNDPSADVSREGLFGLTGRVTFPVSESTGRIHVYDAFGTLHDETCRVAPGVSSIAKGRTVLIVDVSVSGDLIVEECA